MMLRRAPRAPWRSAGYPGWRVMSCSASFATRVLVALRMSGSAPARIRSSPSRRRRGSVAFDDESTRPGARGCKSFGRNVGWGLRAQRIDRRRASFLDCLTHGALTAMDTQRWLYRRSVKTYERALAARRSEVRGAARRPTCYNAGCFDSRDCAG